MSNCIMSHCTKTICMHENLVIMLLYIHVAKPYIVTDIAGGHMHMYVKGKSCYNICCKSFLAYNKIVTTWQVVM